MQIPSTEPGAAKALGGCGAGGIVDPFVDRAQGIDREAQAPGGVIGEARRAIVRVGPPSGVTTVINVASSIVASAGRTAAQRRQQICRRVVGVFRHRSKRIDGKAQAPVGIKTKRLIWFSGSPRSYWTAALTAASVNDVSAGRAAKRVVATHCRPHHRHSR